MGTSNGHSLLRSRSWGQHLTDSVVIIDDSPEILETVGFILKTAGFDVSTAGDGLTGLGLVRKHRPKVVVLDVFLPHMSGFEVMDAIRSDPALSGLFLILVTGMARDEADLKEMTDGADMCLAKPIDDEALVKAVAAALASEDREPGLRRHLRD